MQFTAKLPSDNTLIDLLPAQYNKGMFSLCVDDLAWKFGKVGGNACHCCGMWTELLIKNGFTFRFIGSIRLSKSFPEHYDNE